MAQPMRLYHLADSHGLNYEQGAKKVKDIYPTPGAEREALPWAWKAATGSLLNLSADEFRELYMFTACMLDATYTNEAPNLLQTGFLNTFNRVIIPNGLYLSNANIPSPRGGFAGQNSFPYYGNGADHGMVTTELRLAKTSLKNPSERYILSTPNADLVHSGQAYSYNESYRAEGVALTNEGAREGTIGLLLTMPGELCAAGNIRANGFDIGVCVEGATPFMGGDFSVFDNRVAGIATRGGAQSNCTFAVISGDRNGSLFRQLPGRNGEAAGGRVAIQLMKAEDGNFQGLYGSQVTAWLEGQFVVEIAMASPTTQRVNDAAFVVDPPIKGTTWGRQASYLSAKGLGFNHRTLLHDLSTGKRIAWPADHTAFAFEWFAVGETFKTAVPGDWAWKPAGATALGSLPDGNGTFDYAKGTPKRDDAVGAAPVPPVEPPTPPVEPPTPPVDPCAAKVQRLTAAHAQLRKVVTDNMPAGGNARRRVQTALDAADKAWNEAMA